MLVCILWGARLIAGEPMKPDSFLTRCGIYQCTEADVVRELTIETNKLWFTASTGEHNCSSGSYHWTAARHSFVYVAKDMRVWAYDGDRLVIMLQADGQGARSVPLGYLQEPPPDAVMKRLPKTVRKLLPGQRAQARQSG